MPNLPFSIKNAIKDYFTYPKGQRRAIAFVLALLLPALLFPFVFNRMAKHTTANRIVLQEVAGLNPEIDDTDIYDRSNSNQPDSNRQLYESNNRPVLFAFDPNTATEAEFARLGLRQSTIRTLLNFRNKGGHFYKPEDLKKVYGLRQQEFARLLPYVLIASPHTGNSLAKNAQTPNFEKSHTNIKTLVLEINTADTTQWIALPGIGSKLALRIVKYRNALGGFYNINQVAEVYGLHDSTFRKILPLLVLKNTTLVKRNINTDNPADLRTPYIPNNVANAIVQYRKAHGNFSSVADLKQIPLIDEDLFVKIAPYLTANQ